MRTLEFGPSPLSSVREIIDPSHCGSKTVSDERLLMGVGRKGNIGRVLEMYGR